MKEVYYTVLNSGGDGNHGTNVKDRRREFVDLKSKKVQMYVDMVLGLLDIHYEKY